MGDEYFEDLFNEDRAPFPNFLSRLDSYPSTPFPKLEFPLELDGPIDRLDLESFKLYPITATLETNDKKTQESKEIRKGLEELKESSSFGDKTNDCPLEAPEFRKKAKGERMSKREDSSNEKKQTRAERNKRYAKESRDRKKKYIEDLEQQVLILKREVEIYNARLKNYELIEKFKNNIGNEFYEELRKAQKNMFINNKEALTKSLRNYCNQLLNEQMDVLRLVTKMLMDISLPIPLRVCMWLSDKNIDQMNAKEIAQMMSPIITLEQAQSIIDYEKKFDPDGVKCKKFRELINTNTKKIKDSLKNIIEQQREIAIVFKDITSFISENTMPYSTPYILEIHAKVNKQLAIKPEVRECGIDSLLKNLVLTEEKSESVMEC